MKNCKKYKLIPLLIASVLACASLAGCSSGTESSTGNSSSVSSSSSNQKRQEGLANTEVKAGVSEEATSNSTSFILNGIVDSGMTDDSGNKYIYLDAVIKNSTDKEYDLNMLNNFYLLLPDDSEIHFDVRTQLYGQNNIDNYYANPFTIPANGELSGIFGGFVVSPDITSFTVCFFPTQDEMSNKESVIKVDVTADNFRTL